MSDIGYRLKVYSDIRYNVRLLSLQTDIGRSNVKLSPISLITDIGVSAHLCQSDTKLTTKCEGWAGVKENSKISSVMRH